MSALISFLGGSVFRMIWGEVSAWFTRKQEHQIEIERLRLEAEMAAAQHARNLEAIRVQAELGVKVIEAQTEAYGEKIGADAFLQAVKDVGKKTGIVWLDAWNGAIRPGLATLAAAIVLARIWVAGFVLTDWDLELVGAILGIYVADRSLVKRGK